MPLLLPVPPRQIAERLNPSDFNINVAVGRTNAARREGTGEGTSADEEAEGELSRIVVRTGVLKAAQGEVESVVAAALDGATEDVIQAVLTQPIRDKADGIVSDIATATMRMNPTSKTAIARGGDEDARALLKDARARLLTFKTDLENAVAGDPTPAGPFVLSPIPSKSVRVRTAFF